MDNSHRFFNNKDCKYFPCHKTDTHDKFNCLFCYCPLYHLDCPGNFSYYKNVKVCTDCPLPHQPEFYDTIVEILTNANTN